MNDGDKKHMLSSNTRCRTSVHICTARDITVMMVVIVLHIYSDSGVFLLFHREDNPSRPGLKVKGLFPEATV